MALRARVQRRRAAALGCAVALSLPLLAGATSSTTGDGGLPHCRTSQVAVWLGLPGSGAAGSTYYELQFSNVSGRTCSLFGFPAVSAVTRGHHSLGSPAARDRAFAPSTVALAPGATAHAVLRVTNVDVFSPSACRPVKAAGLAVYPPKQTTAAVVPFPLRGCAKKGTVYLSVRTVRPQAGIPGYSQ